MKSLWNDNDAKKFNKSLLSKRVYTSRLLGQNSDLVLHGGGNTSVKIRKKDFFGNSADYLYVKGSGCDLESIEEKDFSGCKMSTLLKLSDLDLLSDTEMVNQCRSSMIDPNWVFTSVENSTMQTFDCELLFGDTSHEIQNITAQPFQISLIASP